MFDRLSSLAQFHRRPVLVAAVVFFVLAGALGGSVADRLDPYGADDPDTESIQADERLEAAGYRDASVIVLMRDTDPATAAGAERIREIERRVEAEPEVAGITGYLQTRSTDFVSEDGDSSYLAVSLKPTDDKELQEAGSRINEDLAGEPGVSVGGYALATEQVNKQVEEDLRTAEMLAFPVLFLLTFLFFRSGVAAMLPLMVGALAIVGHLPAAPDRERARLDLDLRAQPDHRPRPRPRDRLQPVRGLALPRGDREERARASRR